MNIVSLGPAYPLRGGIANFNESLCLQLQSMGHQVEAWSFSLQYPNFLFPGKTQKAPGPGPEGLHTREAVNSVNPFNWIATGRKIYKQRPDLIVFHYWMPFFAPSLGTIARIAGGHPTKCVALCHNVIPHERRATDKLLSRYFLNSCHGFVAMSHSVMDDLAGFGKASRSHFAPHPIYDIFGSPTDRQEARKRLGLDANRPILLFFGMIRAYKGLDLLLEALAQPSVRALNLQLVVAGEFYEPEAPYREQIARLGIESNVLIINEFIENSRVADFFCAADMVAQTYRSATQSGITQIAYNFGTPMLVTNVGGLAEIVEDKVAGYVCGIEPEAIAGSIADFYAHDRRAQMSQAVADARGRFSWEAMAEAVIAAGKA